MPLTFSFDHIAVSAPSLEAGVAYVRDCLGVEVPPGGAHPKMATHNHLMRLGTDEFLEIISVDPAAAAPKHPRWFALDRNRTAPPRLATWVLRTNDIDAALAAAQPSLGPATELTRGNLRWRISVPDDGAMPFEGAHPTFLEWPPGPLPGTAMPDLGCRLVGLSVHHPNAGEIAERLAAFFADARVTFVADDEIRLTAEIETPDGLRRLS